MKTIVLLSLTLISAVLSVVVLMGGENDLALPLVATTSLGVLIALIAVVRVNRTIGLNAKTQATLSQDIERQRLEGQRNEEKLNQEKLALSDQLKEKRGAHDRLMAQLQDLNTRLKSAEAEVQALRVQSVKADGKSQREATDTAVLQFLRSLQERGRFLDFAMAEIHRLADAQVGAAARVVHQGVRVVLQDYFDIQPISEDAEGSVVKIPTDDETQKFRILGSDSGIPEGRLLHRGWQALSIRLPQSMPHAAASARIIAPAEIDAQGGQL